MYEGDQLRNSTGDSDDNLKGEAERQLPKVVIAGSSIVTRSGTDEEVFEE